MLLTVLFISWFDEPDKSDVVPAKYVVSPEGMEILEVAAGHKCRVLYKCQFYQAKVLGAGNQDTM